jgi:hypothetical protein
MRAAYLLVPEYVPDVPGEVSAFGFSSQERFVYLNGNVEVTVDVAVAESEIKLAHIRPIRHRREQARVLRLPPRLRQMVKTQLSVR